jgi:hypothetical protein
MSAHGMICHLSDALRMATGDRPVTNDRPVTKSTGPLPRTIVKWISLYLPVHWPAGIMTSPEIDQAARGTSPRDFASDVAELQSLVDDFVRRKGRGVWPSHPIFGTMSEAQWFRWAYLHIDHHLRQFGA